MKLYLIVLLILVALLALLVSSSAWSRRTWFMGSLALSFSIGSMLWLHRPYYLVLLLLALMLLADYMIFFFGRTLAILPPAEKVQQLPIRLYRSLVILTLTALVGGLGRLIWLMDFSAWASSSCASSALPLEDFHHFLWGNGFLFIAMVLVLLIVSALGVFFMAKKEN